MTLQANPELVTFCWQEGGKWNAQTFRDGKAGELRKGFERRWEANQWLREQQKEAERGVR
jgi:hypothetical protein